jgi:hypothetical protein
MIQGRDIEENQILDDESAAEDDEAGEVGGSLDFGYAKFG